MLVHAIQSRDLQELELIDFERQQLERDWVVPTRDRQTMVSDLASWWYAWPHARRGKECLQCTGLSNALPAMVKPGYVASDGSFVMAEFKLQGPEDHLITREAGRLWERLDMGKCRAEAMASVHKDFVLGKIQSASDLRPYVEDGSDNEGEMYEGVETLVQDGEDGALADVEAPPSDDEKYFALGDEAPLSKCAEASPAVGDGAPLAVGGEAPLVVGGEAPPMVGGEAPPKAGVPEQQICATELQQTSGARLAICVSARIRSWRVFRAHRWDVRFVTFPQVRKVISQVLYLYE